MIPNYSALKEATKLSSWKTARWVSAAQNPAGHHFCDVNMGMWTALHFDVAHPCVKPTGDRGDSFLSDDRTGGQHGCYGREWARTIIREVFTGIQALAALGGRHEEVAGVARRGGKENGDLVDNISLTLPQRITHAACTGILARGRNSFDRLPRRCRAGGKRRDGQISSTNWGKRFRTVDRKLLIYLADY